MTKRFELDDDLQPWLFPHTGETIQRRGLFVVGSNLLSVENIYSMKFDLEEAGFAPEEIKDSLGDKPRPCGKRSDISDFTKDSQRRFMKSCALWEPVGEQIFITLTYPATWPEPDVRQKQFKKFMDWLRRYEPLWAGCWKLEYQKRGAPHYHLVLQTGSRALNIRHAQQTVAKAWALCIGMKARTEVKRPNNPKRAKYYLTKEVGKMVQASKAYREAADAEIVHKGRFWGWFNRSSLQFKGQAFTLPSEVALMVREAIQADIVAGMKRDGLVAFRDNGTAYFKNSDADIEADMLPAFRVYDDGEYSFNRVRDYVLSKYNVDIFDHMQTKPPPR